MNPLLHKFPRSVEVRGTIFPVRWDFRTCIQLVQINEDSSLAWVERLQIMVGLFYSQQLPEDLDEAVHMMAKFLNGGAESTGDKGEEQPLFSFEKDGTAIYTAILQRYGIDLEQETVHWWKFMAMMQDLDSQSQFVRLLQLRKGWLNGTLSKEEMDTFKELGEAALPPEQPLDDAEREAMETLLRELGEEVTECDL